MNRLKIVLDTATDINEFVGIATTITEPVYLEDGNGLVINAKSLMGVMYGKTEFVNLWVKSDYENLSTKIRKFMID